MVILDFSLIFFRDLEALFNQLLILLKCLIQCSYHCNRVFYSLSCINGENELLLTIDFRPGGLRLVRNSNF